jgi:amino acid transporter
MISHLPLAGGHVTLAARLVDPAFGLACGWAYCANWLLVMPAELSAAATLIGFWSNAK